MRFALLLVLALSQATLFDQFNEYKATYGKVYSSAKEELLRLNNFKHSLMRIRAKNARSSSATYGLNEFSDMSPEEFRQSVLMRPYNPTTNENKATVGVAPVKEINAPADFDWRTQGAVTAVKNQGQCGSCWAFSVTENIESMWILAGKANSSIALAPQQIVDCDNSDDGCNGGEPPTAYQYVIKAGGLETNESYPYTAEDGSCKFSKNLVVASIASWKYATSSGDETTLQKNLLGYGPLSICLDASNWQDYQSGVMTAWECAWVDILDHCVQLVGYNSTTTEYGSPYWIVRNSWGTSWGINGYILLEMGDNTCGLTEEATTSIVGK